MGSRSPLKFPVDFQGKHWSALDANDSLLYFLFTLQLGLQFEVEMLHLT